MAEPASDEMREMARELELAAERGESMTTAALRDQFGLGHDDLDAVLGVLREHGQAVEVAPGEWRGPTLDEIEATSAEPEPVRVRVAGAAELEGQDADALYEETVRPPGQAAMTQVARSRLARLTAGSEAPNVRLTRAIAAALDPESLGKLIKAGIDDSDGPFVLEVLE